MDQLGLNLGYLLVQIFNFLIVFIVLRAWVFVPIMGLLERRRSSIAQGLVTRGQVVRMVLSEAALMGLIGGVMGLVFGVVLSRLFLSAMTSMSGYRLTFVLPLENILAALLIAFLTSQLAAFLPTLRASRIRILEAIQYE